MRKRYSFWETSWGRERSWLCRDDTVLVCDFIVDIYIQELIQHLFRVHLQTSTYKKRYQDAWPITVVLSHTPPHSTLLLGLVGH